MYHRFNTDLSAPGAINFIDITDAQEISVVCVGNFDIGAIEIHRNFAGTFKPIPISDLGKPVVLQLTENFQTYLKFAAPVDLRIVVVNQPTAPDVEVIWEKKTEQIININTA